MTDVVRLCSYRAAIRLVLDKNYQVGVCGGGELIAHLWSRYNIPKSFVNLADTELTLI